MLRVGILLLTRNISHHKLGMGLKTLLPGSKLIHSYEDFYRSLVNGLDIVIAMDSTPKYIPALTLAKARDVLTMAFMHDIRSISHTQVTAKDAGTSPFLQRLRRIISAKLILNILDVILTPSKYSAQMIKYYLGREACVVYPFISNEVYRPLRVKERRLGDLQFRSDDVVILTVATKPHIVKHAVVAYAHLRNIVKNAYLVIRGPCDKIPRLPRVYCLPPLSESELALLYNIADVFLYPSLVEGFGLPVLEAMSCGLPVVAYRLTSMEEVVGDVGILVEPSIRGLVDGVVMALKRVYEKRKVALERASFFNPLETKRALLMCIKQYMAYKIEKR
ncbi:glycosyltransferase [Caldivirga maquilingensis]|uniref:Glycosyl transferase group 1 n=1 Tax=Caldivirga maquilingensis (strain ATCC 700844 / DSM 13496 / JCM 10307 / IC-167) TaxID=397948 RepID=A8M961_CALMQ|nr:glycosyltransferase [Caldivirga maquilingensis]ABW02280.1 glycosyl transferase group 1 [Caldivirga maquilingensis IC-167]